MGLCKCPKRKVTTLFCFEHRINVCDFCLLTDHYSCAVKSYLNWLQDSDFDSSCTLCKKDLHENGEVVRLLCLDTFHLDCLSNHGINGHIYRENLQDLKCPNCSLSVIPPDHVTSALAQKLWEKLRDCQWGRSIFATNANTDEDAKSNVQSQVHKTLENDEHELSDIDKIENQIPVVTERVDVVIEQNENVDQIGLNPLSVAAEERIENTMGMQMQVLPIVLPSVPLDRAAMVTSTVEKLRSSPNVSEGDNVHRPPSQFYPSYTNSSPVQVARKVVRDHKVKDPLAMDMPMDDPDEHKYKRRGPFTWLSRLVKTQQSKVTVLPGDVSKIRKYGFIFLAVFGFVMLIYIASTRKIEESI